VFLDLRDHLGGTILFAAHPHPGRPHAEGNDGVIAV
jgi:hypothetical protein